MARCPYRAARGLHRGYHADRSSPYPCHDPSHGAIACDPFGPPIVLGGAASPTVAGPVIARAIDALGHPRPGSIDEQARSRRRDSCRADPLRVGLDRITRIQGQTSTACRKSVVGCRAWAGTRYEGQNNQSAAQIRSEREGFVDALTQGWGGADPDTNFGDAVLGGALAIGSTAPDSNLAVPGGVSETKHR
jgi:hypothetical protein